MVTLENDVLAVELYDQPVVRAYEHKPTGALIAGGGTLGVLAVNGRQIPWDAWQIETRVERQRPAVTYTLHFAAMRLALAFRFALHESSLLIALERLEQQGQQVHTLDWIDLPLLVCQDPTYSYWREEWSQTDWGAAVGKGLYAHHNVRRQIARAVPDRAAQPTVHACVFNGGLCCFVHSTYLVLPLLTRVEASTAYPGRGGSVALSLNWYQHHVRDKRAPPLQARVVFLSDINGDAQADECDYHLWLNRQFVDPDPRYRTSIWGKIDCATPGRVTTTFSQALELIDAIHHITDGMPLIFYLVGWQYDGHDTGYPSLDRSTRRWVAPRACGSSSRPHGSGTTAW